MTYQQVKALNAVARKLDDFTRAYLECALWAETDNSTPQGGEPLDRNFDLTDFAPEALEKAIDDCRRFQEDNGEALGEADYSHPHYTDMAMAGHGFWLTRNGHGAGFWDRELGDVGDRLTEAAKHFGECYVYVGDDGQLYLE